MYLILGSRSDFLYNEVVCIYFHFVKYLDNYRQIEESQDKELGSQNRIFGYSGVCSGSAQDLFSGLTFGSG